MSSSPEFGLVMCYELNSSVGLVAAVLGRASVGAPLWCFCSVFSVSVNLDYNNENKLYVGDKFR